MAFKFNWPEFDAEFYKEARSQLEAALNKGNKPKNIVDYISVKELNMGTTAPELEILEIGELSTDKFRGIFKLTYCGDAYIVIQTKVQANPMHANESDLPRHTRPTVLAADQPLIVPMLLRISDLKLRGIIVLVVSKTKGITLVFKNDPLESIVVSSTFDSITSVRSFLQREIENQLRNLFQEDLPVMIHNLSLRHIQKEQEKQAKREQEEWLQTQRLQIMKKNAKNTRSVFSDPGIRRSNTMSSASVSVMNRTTTTTPGTSASANPSPTNNRKHFDALSMPDLDTPSTPTSYAPPRFLSSFSYSQDVPLSPLTNPFRRSYNRQTYSSFSDLYFMNEASGENMNQAELLSTSPEAVSLEGQPFGSNKGIPVTAANLSTLNELYSSRFAALKTPPYSDFGDSQTNKMGEDECSYEDYYDESSVNSMIAAEMYADDVDAPWYITEGLETHSARDKEKTLTMMPMDEDIVLNPKENTVAAKLAQLTNIHHTISPFTHTIDHFTYRSLPHTVKVDVKSKSKKKPKRRVIRLNTQSSTTSA
ncbi:Putative Mitochondrial distribution and morphology protein 34 [Rhizopus microsporus]|nr:Putative Mitochondrial distribution and morphology protein 34 [Rhizopus microsporus]